MSRVYGQPSNYLTAFGCKRFSR
ncbi:MAG: hypothetical protein QOF95_1209, partial [Pseudonocardiales bacterium]|nr:hypothetical protein [Pseudonocardiales bacterium]